MTDYKREGGVSMPRNKFPEKTRQRILDAALEVFLEKGYEDATILEIVAATDGLTRGAFYHHFESKEEVLDEIAEYVFFRNNPFEKALALEGLTGLEKVQKAVFSLPVEMSEEQRALLEASQDLLDSPIVLSRQFRFNNLVAKKFIMPIIEEGIEDGSIAPSNPKLLAELMLLVMNIWTNQVLFPGTDEELAEKFVFMEKLFDGIGFPLFHGDEALAAAKYLAEEYFPEADFDNLVEKLLN
jgi:AcrR family transcriptional regulator